MLLRSARTAIKTDRPTPLSRAVGMLYRFYEKDQYSWECVELARKFLLVGVARLPLFEPGSLRQMFYAIAVSLCHLTFLALAKPYVDNSDDYLAVGSAFTLTGVFVVCLLFQVDKLYDAVDTSLTHEYQELVEPRTSFPID